MQRLRYSSSAWKYAKRPIQIILAYGKEICQKYLLQPQVSKQMSPPLFLLAFGQLSTFTSRRGSFLEVLK